jgi:Na+/melibiose symporter-like transporter
MPPQQGQEDSSNQQSLSEPLLPSSSNDEECPRRRRRGGCLEEETTPPSRPPHPVTSEETATTTTEGETSLQLPAVSRNVKFVLIYTWFVFAGRSIWNQNVLATFVYLLRDDNPAAVGNITAVMGLSQLLVSIPSGILADKFRRDTLLKVAAIVGLVAVGITLLALWYSKYEPLVLALAAWGAFWGIANTSLSALFADSIKGMYILCT